MRRRALGAGLLLPLASSLGLAGCVSVGVGNEALLQRQHVLRDPGLGAQARGAARVPALLVQALPSAAVAETLSMAYAPRPNELATYQLATWTERPVRRVPRLLVRRLEAAGLADAVAELGDPLTGDWLLTLRIERLEHDVASPPGMARVQLAVELFDRRRPGRVAQARFESQAATPTADAAAAASALSQALALAFDDLVRWLGRELPPATG